MDHYQEITLLPDAEANLGFLWQKVFQQVHIALAEHKITEDSSAIGVSIPNYGSKAFPLGSRLRLFGSSERLEKLNINQWLLRLTDYVHIKPIRPVPGSIDQHACFRRRHIKGAYRIEQSIEHKAKYQSEKFGVDYGQCVAELRERMANKQQVSSPPFIRVARNKDGDPLSNSFPLFITMELMDEQLKGEFNCYGLSSLVKNREATVPWF